MAEIDMVINLLINGSIALLGVVLGHFVTKNTYIFQKNYERKSGLVIDLYKEVVKLEFELKRYINFIGAEATEDSIERKINELNIIRDNFQSFQHKFWEVEIILEDSTINKINEFLQVYITITSKLSVSHIGQQLGDHKQSFDKWEESFNMVSDDLKKIKVDLRKEFRSALNK